MADNNAWYEERLRRYLQEQGIAAEHLSFQQSCHSVAEAAAAAGVTPADLVKNICLIAENNELIVAIVRGNDRIGTTRVAAALGGQPARMATPDEILARTGYPCGGTPSFGFSARFLVDPLVLERETVFTGGGSPNALVRIASQELLRVNGGEVIRVRK